MNQNMLINYCKNLKKEDIVNYLSKEAVPASKEEIDCIYNALVNDCEDILKSDFMTYISNYKLVFNEELYKKIIEKYNKYKSFIN